MIVRALVIGAALTLGSCGIWADKRAARMEASAEDRWPPVGRFVTEGAVRVHYVQDGTGPDVVLIHGAGGNLRDFTFSLMPRLVEAGYRVTAFDRPGLGYTGRVDPAYDRAFAPSAETPQEQAALLAGAAKQLGVDTPVVLGHSFGGAVAMAWGLEHEASAIVSVAGVAMPWPGELGAYYKVLGSSVGGALVPPLVTASTDPMNTGDVLEGIFAPQSAPDGYLAHIGPGLSLRRDTLRANARQVNHLRPHMVALSERYPEMTLPVEFVHGDADTTVPLTVHANRAVSVLPRARVTVLEDIGHMPHHADEDAILAAIERALEHAGRSG
ncbi:alpha/beta hydrolase [Cognatishimia sp. F0-27]|nr:alpha/beta hydrolase [Cognatishimia sp. F0-27]MCC1493608.1 alpha/beta hydrolase [Cognatishimia sp. F0-27]